MAFESGSSVWGEDSNVNNREKVNLLPVNWQLFKMTSGLRYCPPIISDDCVIAASNFRCRVLPRVRPHPDLSRICTPIFGDFRRAVLHEVRPYNGGGRRGLRRICTADCRGYALPICRGKPVVVIVEHLVFFLLICFPSQRPLRVTSQN